MTLHPPAAVGKGTRKHSPFPGPSELTESSQTFVLPEPLTSTAQVDQRATVPEVTFVTPNSPTRKPAGTSMGFVVPKNPMPEPACAFV